MQSARIRIRAARFITGAILVSAAVPSLAQTILMGVHPLFDGLQPGTGVVPMEVSLANTGADAKGVVRVSVGDFSMSYPVELPQGTKKALVTYPDCREYAGSPLQFDLVTNRGHLHQTVEANGVGRGQIIVAEIAQSNGDLGFLKSQRSYSQFTPQDVYVKPADAPDRPSGYERLGFLVLGEGSERLSDDAVKAIKSWTLSGGTLIFVGGASSPILNDPRWINALPVRDATQKNFSGSKSLATRYKSSPQPFTAMVGTPVANTTSRSDGLIMERPFGLGRSVYLAFNPFENPMNAWGGRAKLFEEIMTPSVMAAPQMVINTVINNYGQNPYSSRYSSYPGYPYEEQPANNPFRASLPETSTVLIILACYFVAVVPLNFLVLRKFRKGELAWGTAPLLSLGFAGVFFAAAQGLYTAQLSTSTKGILIAQQGEPGAIVYGYSQVYFPRGGRYDLKLAGVDAFIQTQDEYYGRYGRNDEHSIYEDIDPTDNGEIQAKISVPNLAFRELKYREQTQIKDWFDVRKKASGHYQITNNSDYYMVNARLVGGDGVQLIGDLKPHASVDFNFNKPEFVGQDISTRLCQVLARNKGLALTGKMRGLRAGPRVGTEVKDSIGLSVAFITNERHDFKFDGNYPGVDY